MNDDTVRLRFAAHGGVKPSYDGRNVWVCCPFCVERGETPDTRFRLGLHLKTGQGHCFNCGWKTRDWRGELGLDVALATEDKPEEPTCDERWPPEGADPVWEASPRDKWGWTALQYLASRDISREEAARWQVHWTPVGRFRYRVLFPVPGTTRKATGFMGRSFVGGEPKYLASHGKKGLWNFLPGRKRVILSEGVFKAARIQRLCSRSGQSIALLGASVSEEHAGMLADARVREVLLWPDPDIAGCNMVLRGAEILEEYGLQVRVPIPAPDEPADEAKMSELGETLGAMRKFCLASRVWYRGLKDEFGRMSCE